MFERTLIFQESDSSLWLLAWIVLGILAAVALASAMAVSGRRWRAAGAGIVLIGAAVGISRFDLELWTTVSIIAVVIAVAMIVLLLKYERRLVRRSVGNTLLVLRLCVLLTFVITLLKPSLTWERNEEHTGRVLVSIDLSGSMNTQDTHAGKAEKLRWARAFGMIGNAETDERLDAWQDAFEAGREPEWVAPDETSDSDRRRELAESRKANLQAVFDSVDTLTRKEIARRVLTELDSPLLPALEELGHVELLVFAGSAEATNAAGLEKMLSEPPRSLETGTSDLSRGLTPIEANADSPLMGIVLLSDGRDNASQDVVTLAARLGNAQAPVFPVMIGTERRPRDLAIAHLDYPQTSYPKDTRLVKALISTSGFENQEIVVVLEREGHEPLTQTVTAVGEQTEVNFEIDEESIGRHELTLRVEPEDGETRQDNNSRQFAMVIVDDKVQVLLVDSEARWEFRYLHNAYARDEGIGRENVQAVVFNQPYLGVLQDTWFPRKLDLPTNPDDLADSPFAEVDLIVLGDVAPADLSSTSWELLERFVSEEGGTLVLTAGKNYFPMAYNLPVVDRLLPITDPQPKEITGRDRFGAPTERGFHLRLTPDGQREAMFQFSTDGPLENQQIWHELAGHTWGIFGTAKPQATVFAVADDGGAALTIEEERTAGVMIQHYVGTGQVLWIGVDSTWRWRHRVGDEYHHRFWGQLARWAAVNKAAAGNEFVRFGVQRPDIDVGEDAVIQARWAQRFLRQHPDLQSRAVLTRVGEEQPDGRPFAELELKPLPNRPLVFEARAVSLPAGEYRVTLRADGVDLGEEELTTSFYVTERPTRELADLSANRKLLGQIADVSGGFLFTPDTVSDLPSRLTPPEFRTTEREEVELWDNWPMLLLFFSLLTAEWLVRKLNGLP